MARASAAGDAIVSAARGQAGYKSSPYGSDCNKFTAYWGAGGACSNGNRSEAWCADFAAWAWAQAGITGLYGHGINGAASSFRTWGQATGRWHPLGDGYVPQPGDVAEYSDAHVGIFTGGTASSPTVINGNWWYPDTGTGQVYEQAHETSNGAGAALSGYVAAPTDGGGGTGDTAAPSAPGSLAVLHHADRVGLGWHPSSDNVGVTSYRVLRDGIVIGSSTNNTFFDHAALPGQTYYYQVQAGDAAGNWSAPSGSYVRNVGETADRATLSANVGPVECGRTGDTSTQRLGCNVLTSNGWRFAGLPRNTDWGNPDARAWQVTPGGGAVDYCRTTGSAASGEKLTCTALNLSKMAWGKDHTSPTTDWAYAQDRAWLSTGVGPAECGRTGDNTSTRLGCNVLTSNGWRFLGLPRTTDWGYPDARAWTVSTGGNSIRYCRTVGGGSAGEQLMCTALNLTKSSWGKDQTSPATDWAYAQDRAWLSTSVGPVECGRTGDATTQRLGCNVLTSSGWRFAGLPRDTDWGNADGRAWLVTPGGYMVRYCRTVGTPAAGERVSCTSLNLTKLTWGKDRTSPVTDWAYPDDRAWLSTGTGAAECGRTGDDNSRRLGCNVLTSNGWRFAGLPRTTDWGYTDARSWTVSPGGNSVRYCRTVGGGSDGERVMCTALNLTKLSWSKDRTSPASDWGYADDFGPL